MKRAAFGAGFMRCNGDQDRKDHGQRNVMAAYVVIFFRFPREDAAADHRYGHSSNKNAKLELLHCGVPLATSTTHNHNRYSTTSVVKSRAVAVIAPAASPRWPRSAAPSAGVKEGSSPKNERTLVSKLPPILSASLS
jgi:hypothetical protein